MYHREPPQTLSILPKHPQSSSTKITISFKEENLMPRYCKICGAKSGRCNHLVIDFGEKEEETSEKKDESQNSETQK